MSKYLPFVLLVVLGTTGLRCNKEENIKSSSTGKLGIYFVPSSYLYHIITIPLRVYVDGELKATWYGNTTTTNCYGQQVDIQVYLEPGSHRVAFVSPDNHNVGGTANITKEQCSFVSLSEDQFSNSKTNYGTSNDSVTFFRTNILINHTSIYVDDVYIGDLRKFSNFAFCGKDDWPVNIVLALTQVFTSIKQLSLNKNLGQVI